MKTAKRVLLPQPIEPEAMTLLEKANCDIVVAPDPSPETVLPLMKDANGLILRTGIKITPELIADANDLMVISRTGGGLDNVDVNAATAKEIIVTSNLGVNTVSVAEQVLAFMFALAKQLPVLDKAVRNDNFAIRYQNLPRDLSGQTLGLLGFGRIGSKIGRICQQVLGMQVVAFDPYLPDDIKAKYSSWVTFLDLNPFLAASDVISIHVPLTDETRHIVSDAEFELMKPEALLINTSRGPVVDEAALIKALQDKRIGGAGLDVFSQEPVPNDSPLLQLENAIFTPHSSALTKECVIRMATEAVRCVLDVFNGQEPPNMANRDILKSSKWQHLKAFETD